MLLESDSPLSDSAMERLLLIPAPNGIICTSCVRTTNTMRMFFRAWLVRSYDWIFSIGGDVGSSLDARSGTSEVEAMNSIGMTIPRAWEILRWASFFLYGLEDEEFKQDCRLEDAQPKLELKRGSRMYVTGREERPTRSTSDLMDVGFSFEEYANDLGPTSCILYATAEELFCEY